jgi:hypothetical protein
MTLTKFNKKKPIGQQLFSEFSGFFSCGINFAKLFFGIRRLFDKIYRFFYTKPNKQIA